MHINLNTAGKRFNRDWIFRNFNYQFNATGKYAVTGPNGSGKSTLMQVIAGSMNLTEGEIAYTIEDSPLAVDKVFAYSAYAAPYLDLIDEMTAAEFLRFHAVFKPLVLPLQEILEIIGLGTTADKQIRNFSSGMRQRLKLAQAIFTNAPLVLLDEPCTNLDAAGYDLYHRLVQEYCKGKLVIVSSNDLNEYDFCDNRINIMDYK